ncbi:MAG TPA: aspartate aminotransferase family protein [Baekduia sp.]|nr:aspartate aminotransferase family protein [Baekduia sp.]
MAAKSGTERSAELFKRAQKSIVEGVNSPSRGTNHFRPYPLYMERGEGVELTDVDGNRYIDMMMGFGSLLHGHSHPRLVKSLVTAAERGALTASNTRLEIEVSELLTSLVPCAERVRLASTGTEAAIVALRIVRAYMGRPKIIKFEGHYHGWGDGFSVSSNPLTSAVAGYKQSPVPVLDSSGITLGAVEDTVVVPWNDLPALKRALERHGRDVAAVVMEGVMANTGVIGPADGYLKAVRELTLEHDVLFWLDETVTGFRVAAGGVQERFGVTADIATYGKALGAGAPVAAIAGRGDILDVLAGGKVLHWGTHNANPLVLPLAYENLTMLSEDKAGVYEHLESLSSALTAGLARVLGEAGLPVVVQGVGPLLHVMFLRPGFEDVTAIESSRDYADYVEPDRFRLFARLLLDEGVYMSALPSLHSVLSTAHTMEHVEFVIAAAQRVASRLADAR